MHGHMNVEKKYNIPFNNTIYPVFKDNYMFLTSETVTGPQGSKISKELTVNTWKGGSNK